MNPILEIQNISKRFFIVHTQPSYYSLRDKLTSLFEPKLTKEEFWALKDISFTVTSGESLAIIGRNGAGKSTLLKILSRITPPTKGRVVVHGRIASLLEVGTGFHQELTGRENIFMNGSILGMRSKEISARFDEIVDFSGIENFLDTPLKHYSSGMQLRLAFAVAAHLDPEILIIDEVLSVGDAEFQKKCLGKMEAVTKSGRTILFVSHQMGLVKQLCTKSIWLDKGSIKLVGDTESIINSYLLEDLQIARSINTNFHLGKGVFIRDLSIEKNPFQSLNDIVINLDLISEDSITIDSLGFYFNNTLRDRVGILDLRRDRYKISAGERLTLKVNVRKVPLIEGEYRVGLFFGSSLVSGNFDDLISLQVVNHQKEGDILPYQLDVRGKIEFDYDFYVEKN